MLLLVVVSKFVIYGFLITQIECLAQKQHLPSEEGFLSRKFGIIPRINNEVRITRLDINLVGTMPKRVRSKSVQKSKKIRRTSSESNNKRTPIPRNCKNTKKKSIVDFDFLSMPCRETVMSSTHVKKEGKNFKNETKDWSSDELDVVFDLQEEKKNKVYEVITVMSDDETPNKITYERLYADDPNNKVVENFSAVNEDDCSINNEDVLTAVGKEKNFVKEKLDIKKETNLKKTTENSATINIENDDSDDDVVCIAVVDAKTKAEQRKANIQEICLSSDSESERKTTVPPIKLQLPISNLNEYMNTFLRNDGSENSFGSNNSNFSYGFRRNTLYKYNNTCGPKSKTSNVLSDWESYSSSPKVTSSDEFSPAPTDSPKFLSGDESSSSVLSDVSQPQHCLSPGSDNGNSSPLSGSDEEKDIYWKADRESRRKLELRFEEYTNLGKKIHQGELEISVESSFTFKVMSYNVLAQSLLEQHMYLYKNHDRRALGWARRWSLLYNEIKDENPEILCLQEVGQSQLASHYAKLMDLGYRWIYKKRTGRYQDGVAVFYKAALFENEADSLVEFHQPGVSVLDRDNVGVIIRLRLKESPTHAIVIATTHLLYNPKRSDVKLAQTQVLLAEIDRLAYNKDALTYYPVIVTGDFNLKPHNGVYRLMTEGELLYEGMSRITLKTPEDHNILPRILLPRRLGITDRCQHVGVMEARVRGEDATRTKLYNSEDTRKTEDEINDNEDYLQDDRFESGKLSHGFNFESVYPHLKIDGQREASTHHDDWLTVDYIFYSTPKVKDGQKKEGSLQLLSRLRLPTQDECERFLRYIPNFACASDHLPLVGKFLLRLH